MSGDAFKGLGVLATIGFIAIIAVIVSTCVGLVAAANWVMHHLRVV